MALAKNDDRIPPLRGGVLGGVAQSFSYGASVRNSFSSASKQKVRQNLVQRDFRPAMAAWDALAVDFQNLWEIAAIDLPLYDRYTTGILSNGRQLFLSYNTNLVFFGQGGSFVPEPPSPPTWGPIGAFFGKTTADDEFLYYEASSTFEAGTILAIYGQPPATGPIQLRRSQMLYLGNIIFSSALLTGETDTSIGDLYASRQGPNVVKKEWNNWSMIYQIERGFVRLVGDPCHTKEPPSTVNLFRLIYVIGNQDVIPADPPNLRVVDDDGDHVFTTPDWGPLSSGGTTEFEFDIGIPFENILHADLSMKGVVSGVSSSAAELVDGVLQFVFVYFE